MHLSAVTEEGNRLYTIGELAGEFSVTTRTIRFYELKGLIAPGAPRRRTRLFAPRPRAAEADPARQEPGLLPGGDRRVPEALRRRSCPDGPDADAAERAWRRTIEDLQLKRADLDRTLKELRDIRAQCVEHLRKKGSGGSRAASERSNLPARRRCRTHGDRKPQDTSYEALDPVGFACRREPALSLRFAEHRVPTTMS